MTEDPVRFKDSADAPGELREILRRGGDVPPLPDDVRAAVLALLPMGAPPVPGVEVAAKATTKIAGAKIAAAAGIAAVAIGAVVAALVWKGAPTSVPAPRPTSITIPSSPPVASSAAEPSIVELPSATAPLPSAKPAPSHRAAPLPEDTLAEENALVDRARANIASNPAQALAAVDEHAPRFPRGQLAQEREYLRVRALRGLGRNDEARARAKRYLVDYPSSPHVHSVRAIVTELEPR
jgi:hypothetical protein